MVVGFFLDFQFLHSLNNNSRQFASLEDNETKKLENHKLATIISRRIEKKSNNSGQLDTLKARETRKTSFIE